MTPQEKKFAVLLAVITAACCAGLYFWAGKGDTRYEDAKFAYDEATNEVNRFNRLALSPTDKSLDQKKQATDSYRAQSEKLIEGLRKFGAEPLTNTDSQAFADRLVKEAAEVKKELEGVELPETFFLGFESYTNTPAQQGATGVLNYQLGAISELTRALAKAKPVSILNFHRPAQPEETGQAYTPAPDAIYRALPLEVAFSGTEKSMRSFLDALQSSTKHFYVIRSLRIINEKTTPPLASDAEFAKARAGGDAAEKADNPFGGAFVLPGDDEKEEEKPAGDAPAPKKEEKPANSELILKQVLGAENINAFFRIDVIRFNPAEEKPSRKGKNQ